MTDNEIIKALEYCVNGSAEDCDFCEFHGNECRAGIVCEALDLIKRQKAEVESLESRISALNDTNKMLMDSQEIYWRNRVREFAEKLKVEMCKNPCYFHKPITIGIIDDLVKEMTDASRNE
ncbi:MAG: hypothetical protein IJM94_02445 [Clostridia bacterium]|nr:hypothetical protein [Clostridia bacterium]